LRDIAGELAISEAGSAIFLSARRAFGLARRHVAVQPAYVIEGSFCVDVADDDQHRARRAIEIAVEADDVLAREAPQSIFPADAPAPYAVPVVQQLVRRLDRDRAGIVRLPLRLL